MAYITLAWRNRTDEGTLSSGSWLSTLPLNNLKNRQVQKVARSSDATNASTKFVIDLGSARAIGVLALIVHNISASGLIRIRGNTSSSFVSPTFDSGWLSVWPSGIIPSSLLEWEDDNFWLGTISASDRAGYQSPYIYQLSTAQTLQYWQVEIDDTGNSDGYVQIGRLFMAATWTPTYNYLLGASLNYEDPTTIETSLSGAEYFDVRSKNRSFAFKLEFMNSTEAYSQLLEMQRLSGTSAEILVIPDSADTTNQVKRAFVGRLHNMGKITVPQVDWYAADIELKELL